MEVRPKCLLYTILLGFIPALSLAIQQMVARRPPPSMSNTGAASSNGMPSPGNGGLHSNANAAKRNRLHQILGRNTSAPYDGSEDHGSSISNEDDALNGLKSL